MLVAVIVRRIILVALVFGPQYFWLSRGWRLLAHTPGRLLKQTGRILLLCAALAIVLVLYDRIADEFLPDWLSYIVTAPVLLWIYTSTFAFFCIQAVHLAGWIWSGVVRVNLYLSHASANDRSRRAFFRRAAFLVGAAPFVPALYGFARERLHFKVVPVDVPIPNLPAALNGMKIVQLSDLHTGEFLPPDEVRRAVVMANRLKADLAVITGDFITGRGDPLEECIAELSALQAPLGVWGCNGNHEIYAKAEKAAQNLFASHGMTLLRQSAAQLSRNGQSFNLIGIDYQPDFGLTATGASGLPGVAALVRRDMPNILLSHNPNTFYRAANLGIELTLSGHTHGGQINLEIVSPSLNPARFISEFVAGLYRLPKSHNAAPSAFTASLYVNRGLGTLGVPARIGAEPEITLLTLRSA